MLQYEEWLVDVSSFSPELSNNNNNNNNKTKLKVILHSI